MNSDVDRNAATNLPAVVIATVTPWSELPRLRHQLTRHLTKYANILYIDFPSNWRQLRSESYTSPEPNLTVWRAPSSVHLPWRLTASLPQFSRLERLLTIRRIRKLPFLRDHSAEGLISFDFRRPWLLSSGIAVRTAFVCNDDFTLFAPSRRTAILIQNQIRESAALAQHVYITSEHYTALVAQPDKTTVIIPGHDYRVPNSPLPSPIHPPIRVGFVGNIDKRLDFKLIAEAGRCAGIELHFIGVCDSERTRLLLSEVPNLRIAPPLYGSNLFDWMLGMNVLWMPYKLPDAWALSVTLPNKTLSYLATGRPVIVSGLRAVTALGPGVILLYKREIPIGPYIHEVLRADTATIQRDRLNIALQHSAKNAFRPIRNQILPPDFSAT